MMAFRGQRKWAVFKRDQGEGAGVKRSVEEERTRRVPKGQVTTTHETTVVGFLIWLVWGVLWHHRIMASWHHRPPRNIADREGDEMVNTIIKNGRYGGYFFFRFCFLLQRSSYNGKWATGFLREEAARGGGVRGF